MQLMILLSCCCPVEVVAQGEGKDIVEEVVDKVVVQRWKSYKHTDDRTVWQSWRRELGKNKRD